MTDVDTRRARRYWWIAALLLPLVNPVLLFVLTLLSGGESLGFVWIALWIGVGNGVFLWRLSNGVWPGPDHRRRRVALGLAVDIALSFAFGAGELILWLLIVCGGGGCWS